MKVKQDDNLSTSSGADHELRETHVDSVGVKRTALGFPSPPVRCLCLSKNQAADTAQREKGETVEMSVCRVRGRPGVMRARRWRGARRPPSAAGRRRGPASELRAWKGRRSFFGVEAGGTPSEASRERTAKTPNLPGAGAREHYLYRRNDYLSHHDRKEKKKKIAQFLSRRILRH